MAELDYEEIDKHIQNVSYPAKKDDLLKEAQRTNAGEFITSLISELPDMTFTGQQQVNDSLRQTFQKQMASGPHGLP